MRIELKKKIGSEFTIAIRKFNDGKLSESFHHFERIHVLGQKNIYWHVLSHIYMLKIALKTSSFGEIIGQLIRIPLAVLGSAIGVVPTGNTGGSNVGLFKRMPIPDELQVYFES